MCRGTRGALPPVEDYRFAIVFLQVGLTGPEEEGGSERAGEGKQVPGQAGRKGIAQGRVKSERGQRELEWHNTGCLIWVVPLETTGTPTSSLREESTPSFPGAE